MTDIWYKEYLAVAAQLDTMTQERDELRALLRECRSGWYLNEELNARIDAALKGDDRE